MIYNGALVQMIDGNVNIFKSSTRGCSLKQLAYFHCSTENARKDNDNLFI